MTSPLSGGQREAAVTVIQPLQLSLAPPPHPPGAVCSGDRLIPAGSWRRKLTFYDWKKRRGDCGKALVTRGGLPSTSARRHADAHVARETQPQVINTCSAALKIRPRTHTHTHTNHIHVTANHQDKRGAALGITPGCLQRRKLEEDISCSRLKHHGCDRTAC